MMMFEEQMAWIKSVSNMASAVMHERMKKWTAADKLLAYNTLLEPPASIREANAAQAKRLWEEGRKLGVLEEQLNKIREELNALPSITTFTHYDGTKGAVIVEGILPNGDSTSTNEATALKMLAEYNARTSA